MTRFLSAFLVCLFLSPYAISEVPHQPPNPCYGGCTKKMHDIYSGFLKYSSPPTMTSRVYSGNCYFKSPDFNPNQAHRSLILLDRHPSEEGFYFATGFTFFGSPTKYADWDLDFTRERTHGAWDKYGPIEINENTARVVTYNQDKPAWIYYMRQDPLTQNIYYITYWGSGYQISFCELTPNH